LLKAPRAAGYGAGASVLGAGLDMLPFAPAITIAGMASAPRAATAMAGGRTRNHGPFSVILLVSTRRPHIRHRPTLRPAWPR
jgi:hypothetical protein